MMNRMARRNQKLPTRSDLWTDEQDMLVAEIVVQAIAEGKTQLKGFIQAAEQLERTPAAVGFRFNKVLREKYKTSIERAKNIRRSELYKTSSSKKSVVEVVKSPTPQVTKLEVDTPIIEVPKVNEYSDTGIYSEVANILRQYDLLHQEVIQLRKENALLKAGK